MIRLVVLCERASRSVIIMTNEEISFLFEWLTEDFFKFQVTRICDRILKNSIHGLPDCALTGHDCITFSRNKMYAYKCRETHVSQDRRGEEQREESLYSTIYFK